MDSSSPPTSIAVHGPAQPPGHTSISGYCQKLETFLRHSRVPYTLSPASFRNSPSGKVPFVTLNGSEVITDSSFIIRTLISRGIAADPDAALTPLQRADSRALGAWTDELVYPAIVHTRWARDHNYAAAVLTMPFPALLRAPLGWYVRRHILSSLWTAGVGRYEAAQIDELIKEWIAALEVRLAAGSGRWMMGGEEPSGVDCTVWGFLVNVLEAGAGNSEVAQWVRESKVLVEYVRRGGERWFPEWDEEMWARLMGESQASD
ncbi:hypothetical protein EDC01DRAFT_718614 [Geopyxis carbonaria]|nr:hypothetical protein EDC01DRAFT_718614 [Geopyxis carbonaria]